MILNYALRKEMWLLEVGDRYKDEPVSIKYGIQKIMEEYIKTDEGRKFFEDNHKKIFLCHFVEIINQISKDCVVIFSATDILIDMPICAVFGKYDKDYPLLKHSIDRLLKSVNLYDEIYLFRPLLLDDGKLVGIGFISDEVMDDDAFSLQEFLTAAAKSVSETSEILENKTYENQGHYYKLIDLRF